MDVALTESDVEAIKSYWMEKNKAKMEKYETAQKVYNSSFQESNQRRLTRKLFLFLEN